VLGIPDADSGEHDSGSKNVVITPVACAVPNRAPNAPKLSGVGEVRLAEGSLLRSIYDSDTVHEEYFCNYEVNPEYEGKLEAAGLCVTARGLDSEARAVEIRGHRFFLATLFQPQLSSTADRPHPVFLAYLRGDDCLEPGHRFLRARLRGLSAL
jgi:CTP synthase (UTP-ammonia lyase)